MAISFTPGGLYMILTTDDSVFIGTVNNSDTTSLTMTLSEDSDPFAATNIVTIATNQIIAYMEMPPE